MRQTASISICIIGDLLLDFVAYAPTLHAHELGSGQNHSLFTDIHVIPGGTAAHAASAARQLDFGPVVVIGKVGVLPDEGQPDIAAQLLESQLQAQGVQLVLAHDSRLATGSTMITYFANDMRIMISNRAASGSFAPADITPAMRQSIARSDILFVSGYALLTEAQRQTTEAFMRLARDSGRMVALDLVPHQIYKVIDLATFERIAASVSLLITEVNTIHHFLPAYQTANGASDSGSLLTLAEALLQRHDAVVLRATNDVQHIFDKHGRAISEETNYAHVGLADRRGYLDRVSLRAVKECFSRMSRGAD